LTCKNQLRVQVLLLINQEPILPTASLVQIFNPPSWPQIHAGMKILFNIALAFLAFATLQAQRNPIEIVVGNKRTSADVTFAKGIDPNNKWVLFNRSRYLVPTDRTQKPTFGTGLGVLYHLNHGLYAGFLGAASSGESVLRTGLYYRFTKNDFALRSVLATLELRKNPSIDSWVIASFSPKIGKEWRFFSQLELAGKINWTAGLQQSAIRSRLGLAHANWQFGWASDRESRYLHQPENTNASVNNGIFVLLQL
jgi:hypothetical protein